MEDEWLMHRGASLLWADKHRVAGLVRPRLSGRENLALARPPAANRVLSPLLRSTRAVHRLENDDDSGT